MLIGIGLPQPIATVIDIGCQMDIQNRLGSPIQIIAIGLPQPIEMLIGIGLP
jgi:hypothetical protein